MWINNKPVIGGRFAIWGDKDSPQTVAQKINASVKDEYDPEGSTRACSPAPIGRCTAPGRRARPRSHRTRADGDDGRHRNELPEHGRRLEPRSPRRAARRTVRGHDGGRLPRCQVVATRCRATSSSAPRTSATHARPQRATDDHRQDDQPDRLRRARVLHPMARLALARAGRVAVGVAQPVDRILLPRVRRPEYATNFIVMSINASSGSASRSQTGACCSHSRS